MESSAKDQGVKKADNVILVSTKKNPNFYVFLGKQYLNDHETIEIHALGNAVSTGVIAAENLVRYSQIITYSLNFLETGMLTSQKSKQRPSLFQVNREKARRPSCSSHWRRAISSMKTWKSSTRSEKRTKRKRKRASNE